MSATPGGGREAATASAEHAQLITARLPVFAALWIGLVAVWCALQVLGGRLEPLVAAAHLGVISVGFVAAILVSRRDPARPTMRWVALAACLVVAVSSSVVLGHMHGYGEVLGFAQLIMCLSSALMFVWGWGPATMLAVGSFIAWWVVQPELRLFVSHEELWFGYVAGSAVSIALAEASARSFYALWQQRRAERAALVDLEASHDAYRDLAEQASDQIWVADVEGRITYANEAAARYHRVPVSALIGHPVFAMITDHPQNPDAKEALARIVRGENLSPLRFQVAPRPGDADIRWHDVLVSAIRSPDGRVVGVRGISRDVTERARAEEQLRESEERFRGAFSATSVGLSITDLHGRALQLNDAICAMLGYSREELMEMTIDDVTHPDDRFVTNAERQRLMTGERPAFTLEKRFIRRDGQVVWGLISVSPLRDASGAQVAFIALVQDVTERRLADEALHRSHQELGQSREKLRRLARQQTAIREEERKRLGLDLHDDVCQELVGLSIMVESLRRRLEPMAVGDAAELARIAQVANSLGDHLRLLAHELRPVQLGDLGLEGSLRSLAAGLSTETCPIEVAFPTLVPRFDEGTEVGVYRIAQEALTNAMRHAQASRVELMVALEGESLRLEVCDAGSGFVVADAGDGFGLFGMEERALGLGGGLHVWSSPGEGTTVRLTCPVQAEGVTRREETPLVPRRASMVGR